MLKSLGSQGLRGAMVAAAVAVILGAAPRLTATLKDRAMAPPPAPGPALTYRPTAADLAFAMTAFGEVSQARAAAEAQARAGRARGDGDDADDQTTRLASTLHSDNGRQAR